MRRPPCIDSKNQDIVFILTLIMTENFPIPLSMLYHIPGEGRA